MVAGASPSRAPTDIDCRPGGAFSCFGGILEGRILEVVDGERLVQAWRVKAWEPGKYSVVRFELSPREQGCRVRLQHDAFPAGMAEHLARGWHDTYWEPLRTHLAKRS